MANEQLRNEILQAVRANDPSKLAAQVAVGGVITHIIDIDYVSSEGRRYVGALTVKKPNIGEMMKASAIKSQMLHKLGIEDIALVDKQLLTMLSVIGTLEVGVVGDRPSWFKDIQKVGETDLLYHVYDLYMLWWDSFRLPDKEEPEEDSGTAKSAEAMADS